jgi:hypothetical protein
MPIWSLIGRRWLRAAFPVGINAPPMTFETGGRQYLAIMTGLSRVSKLRITLTPELREIRNQTMLFVFGL